MEKNEEQLAMEQLEILQKEIAAELNHPEAYGYDEPYSGYNPQTSAARKPYRINDLILTLRATKKWRFSLTQKN